MDETILSTAAGIVLGAVLGTIVTILVSRHYYRRATQDLKDSVDQLHHALRVIALLQPRQDGRTPVGDEEGHLRAVQTTAAAGTTVLTAFAGEPRLRWWRRWRRG